MDEEFARRQRAVGELTRRTASQGDGLRPQTMGQVG